MKNRSGPGNAKVGLDDYLCANPLETFRALPRLALKHAAFTRTNLWWHGWVKRTEEANDAGAEATALNLLGRAKSVRVLHPAQDVVNGVLWYGLRSTAHSWRSPPRVALVAPTGFERLWTMGFRGLLRAA